jgi:predicted ATP-dependent endonuclease of OLD family
MGHLSFRPVPDWLDAPKSYRGVSPSLDLQPIKLKGVFHQYNLPPATVTAKFDNNVAIKVYIGEKGTFHAVIFDPSGSVADSQQRVNRLKLGRIAVLPQIAPVSEEELILNADYVKRSLDTNLASLHFRNQVNLLFTQYFGSFKQLSEATWPSLQVKGLDGEGLGPGAPLELMIRNLDFVGEVSLMGHGLQMWLQTMWFVSRSLDAETLILDEPDVYMHADLQRRLIRFLRNKRPQLIIATHSVEIMGEVDPQNVLVVDRGRRKARFASDLYSLEPVVSEIGGIHNLQLARLWNAKRCLFVEATTLAFSRD